MDHENIRLIKRVEALEAEITSLKPVIQALQDTSDILALKQIEAMQATGGTTQPEKRGRGRPRKS